MSKKLTTISSQVKDIFQCQYCPRSFSRRGAFRNHLRSHRDEIYLDENEFLHEVSTPTTIRNTFQRTVLSPVLINDSVSLQNDQFISLQDWEDDVNSVDVDFEKAKEVGFYMKNQIILYYLIKQLLDCRKHSMKAKVKMKVKKYKLLLRIRYEIILCCGLLMKSCLPLHLWISDQPKKYTKQLVQCYHHFQIQHMRLLYSFSLNIIFWILQPMMLSVCLIPFIWIQPLYCP